LKTLSLAMALLLWSFVHGTKIVERELALPVRFAGLPDSLMITSDPRATVRVLVSGATQEFAFERLVSRAGLHLDLSRSRPPAAPIVPVAADVGFGAGAHLTAVRVLEPAVIELALDRRADRHLPVRVPLKGEPAAGFCLRSPPRVDPAEVRCVGAAARFG